MRVRTVFPPTLFSKISTVLPAAYSGLSHVNRSLSLGTMSRNLPLVMVEVTIASSYSKIYRCSLSKPDVQLARFGKASKDLARTGGDRDLFDDRPATGDRFDRQGVPLFL